MDMRARESSRPSSASPWRPSMGNGVNEQSRRSFRWMKARSSVCVYQIPRSDIFEKAYSSSSIFKARCTNRARARKENPPSLFIAKEAKARIFHLKAYNFSRWRNLRNSFPNLKTAASGESASVKEAIPRNFHGDHRPLT